MKILKVTPLSLIITLIMTLFIGLHTIHAMNEKSELLPMAVQVTNYKTNYDQEKCSEADYNVMMNNLKNKFQKLSSRCDTLLDTKKSINELVIKKYHLLSTINKTHQLNLPIDIIAVIMMNVRQLANIELKWCHELYELTVKEKKLISNMLHVDQQQQQFADSIKSFRKALDSSDDECECTIW